MRLAVLHVAPIAVVTEIVSSFAGTIVVMTGTFASCARALAVLRGLPRDRVEWVTAIGFAMGMAVTLRYATSCRRRCGSGDTVKEMPRGFLIRAVALSLGIVPLVVLLHFVQLPGDLAGVAVFVYAVAGGSYFGSYGVRHQDEIPTRAQHTDGPGSGFRQRRHES